MIIVLYVSRDPLQSPLHWISPSYCTCAERIQEDSSKTYENKRREEARREQPGPNPTANVDEEGGTPNKGKHIIIYSRPGFPNPGLQIWTQRAFCEQNIFSFTK
ncbi:hypothetical protein AMECASPLE_039650 [Ameca splendens]|uniref:Uncharacterized protein n=1 Tax=Ameca splendens TaxID=208324 RepID=A0ABV1A3W6_9TELE